MFAEARDSDMDLVELGRELEARKAELMGEDASEDDMPPPSSRQRGQASRMQTRIR